MLKPYPGWKMWHDLLVCWKICRDLFARLVYIMWLVCKTVTHCNTLQRIATHCNTLQHTATQLVYVVWLGCTTCLHRVICLRFVCVVCWNMCRDFFAKHVTCMHTLFDILVEVCVVTLVWMYWKLSQNSSPTTDGKLRWKFLSWKHDFWIWAKKGTTESV